MMGKSANKAVVAMVARVPFLKFDGIVGGF